MDNWVELEGFSEKVLGETNALLIDKAEEKAHAGITSVDQNNSIRANMRLNGTAAANDFIG
jgi:hypothetical protein